MTIFPTEPAVLQVVTRLRKDLRHAALTLTPDEVRFLVQAYYIMQEDRKRTANQTRALTDADKPHDVLAWLWEQNATQEKDIKADLTGARMVISAETLAHKYHKEIALPSAPRGNVERLYRNGILELTLWKE